MNAGFCQQILYGNASCCATACRSVEQTVGKRRIMRKDTDNRTVFLIFTNMVLFLALEIAVLCLLQVN